MEFGVFIKTRPERVQRDLRGVRKGVESFGRCVDAIRERRERA